MTADGKELEVKFHLPELTTLRTRLEAVGARLEQPRVHEVNLRFDTPDDSLARSYRVLRLRQDTQARLTYKGPGTIEDEVRARTELEFTVGDFDTAKALLEALGYRVSVMYEKYRTQYAFEKVIVTLDEMPYGYFAEIEGPDGPRIQAAARRLELDWSTRILDSYLVLFERLRAGMGLTFKDLSFANFQGLSVSPVWFQNPGSD